MKNASKKIKAEKAKYFLTCIENLLAELRQLTTPLGKSLRADTENRADPTIQPIIVHLKKVTGPEHNERNHFPIGSLNSGIDVPRSGRNIDNRTGLKPQGPIVTTIPESNKSKNCDIFNLVGKTSVIVYRNSPWHGTIKK